MAARFFFFFFSGRSVCSALGALVGVGSKEISQGSSCLEFGGGVRVPKQDSGNTEFVDLSGTSLDPFYVIHAVRRGTGVWDPVSRKICFCWSIFSISESKAQNQWHFKRHHEPRRRITFVVPSSCCGRCVLQLFEATPFSRDTKRKTTISGGPLTKSHPFVFLFVLTTLSKIIYIYIYIYISVRMPVWLNCST